MLIPPTLSRVANMLAPPTSLATGAPMTASARMDCNRCGTALLPYLAAPPGTRLSASCGNRMCAMAPTLAARSYNMRATHEPRPTADMMPLPIRIADWATFTCTSGTHASGTCTSGTHTSDGADIAR